MTSTRKLEIAKGMCMESTKTYTHAEGLSCVFRQWRANHSHCQYLHGYAISVELVFRTQVLDDRNWVVDFGGLKQIKQWLKDTFDHKTLVARDDPKYKEFEYMDSMKLIQMVPVDHIGCEAFAKMIYDHVESALRILNDDNRYGIHLQEVEVKEHDGNGARYRRIS